MFTRRGALAGAGAVSFFLTSSEARAAAAGLAAPVPPSIEELLRKPEVLGVSMSPDGGLYAVLREQRAGGKRTAYVLLVDAAKPDAPPRTVVIGDIDVESIR